MAAFPPISRAGFQIPESFSLFNSLLHTDLEDKELRLIGWENLKLRAPIGPLNIPKMMQEIEQESLNNGKPLVDHVDALFNRLTEKLRPDFEATQLPGEEFKTTEVHLTALQARLQKRYEDEALLTIWNVRLQPIFQQQGAFQNIAPSDGVEEIRAWLNNSANTETIQRVIEMDLSSLALKALPSEIGLFIGLREIDLHNNRLSFLPESFGNLSALTALSLYGNPLMLVSDKELNKIRDYQTYLAPLEPLKKYTPQSPLATLFHAIIFKKTAETIQQAYALLPLEMQHRIATLISQDPTHLGSAQGAPASISSASSSSDPSLAQDNLFTNIGLFARSVRKATQDLYESLGQEQKRLVHWHIWDLAGRPETDDSNWGERHVFDHVLRFTDALERATQN